MISHKTVSNPSINMNQLIAKKLLGRLPDSTPVPRSNSRYGTRRKKISQSKATSSLEALAAQLLILLGKIDDNVPIHIGNMPGA